MKVIGHLKTIVTHKHYVRKYCWMCRLYWRGLVHDLSKFSPTEFWESVKYYSGTRSPIDACKEEKGYSLAWFHHRGRNKHHWEFWVDDFEKGMIPKKMSFKYALEMICDFLGAGQAYQKDQFTISSEYDWWQKKKETAKIHPDTIALVDAFMDKMMIVGIRKTLRDKKWIKQLKEKYEKLN